MWSESLRLGDGVVVFKHWPQVLALLTKYLASMMCN